MLAGKFDNAGHLMGFAAECAIKHRITSLRPQLGAPHGHLPDILIAARKQLGQRANYTSMFSIIKNDIFQNWHVNRRYCATGDTSNHEIAEWGEITKRILASASIKEHK
jgi:hypothetical protein